MFEGKIQINGKEIKVKFGAFVLKKLADDGIRVSDLSKRMEDNPGDTIPKIIYYGAINASPGRGGEGFDVNDIYDWIDEQPGGLLSESVRKMVLTFFEQLNYGVPKNQKAEAGK